MGTLDWVSVYAAAQILYLLAFAVMIYFLTRRVDRVDPAEADAVSESPEAELPFVVLAYPVLDEDEPTMHSTLTALSWLDYPRSRYRIVAIPNHDDTSAIEALERLRAEFPFLEIRVVPPTTDPSWDVVWRAWESNPRAYWFHQGSRRGVRDLPPKKTRQLVYLLYTLVEELGTDWVLDYIDADSMPGPDHFRLGAAGLRHYDVLQTTNVAGNLLDSVAASYHAFDHMCWDGFVYPHMSAGGGHPYYVLGKGLFYRARDLVELGGFHPWIAIEDPEIGLRLWANGRRLGIIEAPLIEEVPRTFRRGIAQRNRWMCGFFQTLGRPLARMGMPLGRRLQARLNLGPVLSLPINLIGVPTGAYALHQYWIGADPFAPWLVWLSLLNILLYALIMGRVYWNAWRRTRLVLDRTWQRLYYVLRVNPLFMFLYYMLWSVPIAVGFSMFLADRGRVWIRTRKFDADRRFVSRGRDRWPKT